MSARPSFCRGALAGVVRRTGRAAWLFALFLLAAGLLAGCDSTTGVAASFEMTIEPAVGDPTQVRVRVTSTTPGALRPFESLADQPRRLEKMFFLTLAEGEGGQIPILGRYRVTDRLLEFSPQVRLMRGKEYLAVFDPAEVISGGARITQTYAAPDLGADAATTVVTQVYPMQDELPENILRFYIHFSAPMAEGSVLEHFHMLDAEGAPIVDPFRELELWSDDHQRLTLLVHPGRIKKGLALSDSMGPVLEAGKSYTFRVDQELTDANGLPLATEHRKRFAAIAAIHEQPGIDTWELLSPLANSREPLRVGFPNVMDHALAQRMLWIENGAGERVAGRAELNDQALQWTFSPEAPWQEPEYYLHADVELEDPMGSSLHRPFEVLEGSRPFEPSATPTHKRAFQVLSP